MCDPDLETALDVRDLHVTEVRDQIIKQLTRLKRQDWKENFNTFIYRSEGTMASSRLTRRPTFRPLTRTLPLQYCKMNIKLKDLPSYDETKQKVMESLAY